MFNLKKLLFGGAASPANLAPEVRDALTAWRSQAGAALDKPHFHSRYVVVDIATTGTNAENGSLLGIAALAMGRGGVVQPGDALLIDLRGQDLDPAAIDRQLMALLAFTAKCPLVGYRVPFVAGVLQPLFRERLGLDFQPAWIDLAWLLADLFKEVADTVVPRDAWLESFGIAGGEVADPVANALALARLVQIALPRAAERGMETPGKLADAAQARRFLRQSA